MIPYIAFDRVTCRKTSNHTVNDVLREVSFAVQRGEMVTILGPSGAGKSTIFRLLTLLDTWQEGTIAFEGTDIRDSPAAALRSTIGMVQQLPHLFEMSVRDNLLFAPRLHRTPLDDETRFVDGLLQKVNLPVDLAGRLPNELSVGQQMRVTLARTLANRPKVLLLDEPTASLDPASKQRIVELIQQLHREDGLTVLMIVHDIELARRLDARAVFLHEGRLLIDAPIAQWESHTECKPLQDFMAGKLQ